MEVDERPIFATVSIDERFLPRVLLALTKRFKIDVSPNDGEIS